MVAAEAPGPSVVNIALLLIWVLLLSLLLLFDVWLLLLLLLLLELVALREVGVGRFRCAPPVNKIDTDDRG